MDPLPLYRHLPIATESRANHHFKMSLAMQTASLRLQACSDDLAAAQKWGANRILEASRG